jgi:hypothetical protein
MMMLTCTQGPIFEVQATGHPQLASADATENAASQGCDRAQTRLEATIIELAVDRLLSHVAEAADIKVYRFGTGR